MTRRTELLAEGLELIEVSLVLLLVLDLLLDALEDTDGGRVIVDTAGGADCSLDDGGGGDEIVGKAVVEATLDLEEVLGRLEEGHVALREGLEGLLAVCAGGGAGEGGGDAGRGGAGAEEGGRDAGTQHGVERRGKEGTRRAEAKERMWS